MLCNARRISKNWLRDLPLSRGSQFDDSALQPNSHSVRSVVRAQFGKNALDVAFDSLFSNRESIRNDLVCVPRCNQSEYFDFSRSQSVVCKVVSNLRGDFGWDPLLAGMNCANRVQQLNSKRSLQ